MHWDLLSNSVQVLRPGNQAEVFKFEFEINEGYVAELAHFIECVQNGARPRFTLEDAILTLRIALAARAAAEEKKLVRFE